jgi:predicted RNase H-like HicB family nuclease
MTTATQQDARGVNERTLELDPIMQWQPVPQMVTLPQEMLDRYISVAMEPASPRKLEGKWYCSLDRFPGVWADAESLAECLDTLRDVLRDWLVLKLANHDTDVPVVDEIDLTSISRRF